MIKAFHAAILCMKSFDHLIYPKRITNGMAYLYSHFKIEKPLYHHIKISEPKSSSNIRNQQSVDYIKKDRQHVHIAFRVLLDHADQLLKSDELSLKAKNVFGEEMENILLSHQLVSSELSKIFNSDNEYDQHVESIN